MRFGQAFHLRLTEKHSPIEKRAVHCLSFSQLQSIVALNNEAFHAAALHTCSIESLSTIFLTGLLRITEASVAILASGDTPLTPTFCLPRNRHVDSSIDATKALLSSVSGQLPTSVPSLADVWHSPAIPTGRATLVIVPLHTPQSDDTWIVLEGHLLTTLDLQLASVVSESLKTVLGQLALKRSLAHRAALLDQYRDPPIGQSSSFVSCLAQAKKLAASKDATIVLVGETGVGKEVLARWIHENGSRAKSPFVGINVGAIPDALLDSELFGHEKGAFTSADKRRIGKLESAGDGTLFIDELQEMPQYVQVKLLRRCRSAAFVELAAMIRSH